MKATETVLSWDAAYYMYFVQGDCGWDIKLSRFKWKLVSSPFPCTLSFEYVNEILKWEHSNSKLTSESVDKILKN